MKKQAKTSLKKNKSANRMPLIIIASTIVLLFGISYAMRPVQATNIIIEIDGFDHSSWDKNFTVLMHQAYVDDEDKAISEVSPSFSIPLPADPEFNSSYTELRLKGFEGVNGLIPEGEGWLGRTVGDTLIFNSTAVYNNTEGTKTFTFLADDWNDFTVDMVIINYTKVSQGIYYEWEYLCFNATTNETETCWNADYMNERVRVNISLAGFEVDQITYQLKTNYENAYIKIRIPANFTVAYAYYNEAYEGDTMGEILFETISEYDGTYLLISQITFYKTSFTLYMPFRRVEEES